MRFGLFASLFCSIACGGSSKPAAAPAGDTSSLESRASSSNETAEAPDAGAHAEAPASAGAGAPAEEAPAKVHPVPAVTGVIDGKPFAPTLAHVLGKMQKDGRILLSIDEGGDCATASDATLTMMVPWQDGYKADLGSLKRSAKKGGEIGFARTAGGKKPIFSKTFKPSGTVTIVKAPMEANAVGKMKIDMQSGDYMLAGNLDIQVCVAPK